MNEAAGAANYPYTNEIPFQGLACQGVIITAMTEDGNFVDSYYGLSAVRFRLYGTVENPSASPGDTNRR